MNALQTLLLVEAAGGVLSRDGDHLNIAAPKGAMPPPLLNALRENKAGLMAILSAAPQTYAEHSPRNLHDEA
jgi:hypothetical protein